MMNAISKLGSGVQALFWFVVIVAPIAGSDGRNWPLAFAAGVVAIIIFMFGKHMGREEAMREAARV
jgi:hypothetical protein